MNSFNFAGNIEFTSNLQQGIHLSKMVSWKGRIGPYGNGKEYLEGKAFANDYWAEVVTCETYIMNRRPTKSVRNVVHKEAWSGRKHGFTHMRVFGSMAYAHAPDELRNNLDNKGEKCIFVRYSDESKAYKLYKSSTKKVIINRDVQLIEKEAWDRILEKTTT